MKIQHSREELAALWRTVKDYPSMFVGHFTGLKSVPFDISLREFEARHRKKVLKIREGIESKVITDINEALKLLNKGKYQRHHLSCAGRLGYIGKERDTALCVHYFFDNNEHAVAVPGIAYVATQETVLEIGKYRLAEQWKP